MDYFKQADTRSGHSPFSELTILARQALLTEAQAIDSFARSVDDDFAKAIMMLCRPNGRIVVTGIGKSGHVGRKFAATLSSVGQPALFVHPSEASHGDLGMIIADDLLFAISNSGETPELRDVLNYSKGIDLPLVALVGPANSSLARRADHCISYGSVAEVCANGLAPTTSTTLAIAICDALSVGVTHVLGTTPDHFHQRHPRGRLGASLMQVCDLMHIGDALPLVPPDLPMPEVVQLMSQRGFGVAIVANEEGRAFGVITDGDLRRHVSSLAHAHASDLITGLPITVPPHMLVVDALALMTARAITSVVVAGAEAKILGLLHIHDCLRAGH